MVADYSGHVDMKKQQELQSGEAEAERTRCYLLLPAATVLVAPVLKVRSCETPKRVVDKDKVGEI